MRQMYLEMVLHIFNLCKLDIDEEYFVIWMKIGMCWKAATVLHILCNETHFSMLVENNYLAWFEYTDFHILINPFTANIE